MIYNTILVHLGIYNGAAPQLKFARELASRFDANLIGFAAGDIHPITAPPPGVILDDEFLRLETREIERRLVALKAEFEDDSEREGGGSLRTAIGDPTRELAIAARAADLVIAGLGLGSRECDGRDAVDLGELVHSAGRPVLIPRDDLEPLRANSVVVAWKDAREARRAVVDAMPFLVHAREVLVATIADRDQDLATASAGDVVRYLVNHGARARAEVFSPGDRHDGEALADISRQNGADLIVSGAYGHTRFREWLLGGVTRSLLTEGTLNRLMSA
ncbi:universal stress protein [Ensifer sp. NBAIM29]|nr:universal stress protein [Ensifer sp. NBAIM29]